MEIVVLLVYSYLVLLITRWFLGDEVNSFFSLIPLLWCLWFYNAKNFAEEYNLVFTLASVAVIVHIYTERKHGKNWLAFILGACTAAVSLIKMSDAPVSAVIILLYVAEVLQTKRSFWKEAARFVAGFAAVAVPVCIYLCSINAFFPMLQEYLLNNFVHVLQGKKNLGFFETRKWLILSGYGWSSFKPVLMMMINLILAYLLLKGHRRQNSRQRWMLVFLLALTATTLFIAYISDTNYTQHMTQQRLVEMLSLLVLLRALLLRFEHVKWIHKYSRSGILLCAVCGFAFVAALYNTIDPNEFAWSETHKALVEEKTEFREELLDYEDSVYAIGTGTDWYWYNDFYPAYPYYNIYAFIRDGVGIGIDRKFEEFLLENPIEAIVINRDPEFYRGYLTNETVEFLQTDYEVVYESEYNTFKLLKLI